MSMKDELNKLTADTLKHEAEQVKKSEEIIQKAINAKKKTMVEDGMALVKKCETEMRIAAKRGERSVTVDHKTDMHFTDRAAAGWAKQKLIEEGISVHMWEHQYSFDYCDLVPGVAYVFRFELSW